MNVESRLPAVYPTFHNTQQQRQQPQPTQKEIDIDNSIYQLLSIYLDGNANGILLPPSTQDSRTMMMKQSSYTRIIKKLPTKGQNWLGETKEPVIAARTELERNTINNSYTIKVEPGTRITKKSRSKSVSFNETVTVINQDKSVSCSNLMQPSASSSKHDVDEGNSGDEDLFVDAVENSID